ncbi:hypothetical protein GCM10010430_13100 [Kitasatospora cystarginea]|uniref:Uncharacterized protein n=1 Tax=Kitasatospora cystarginea TaxID=58350 RepID=A0ABN3DJZ2_9ACTN
MNAKLRDRPREQRQRADAAACGAPVRGPVGLERAGQRSGRHGRPRPFGGFRLPGLRFSGAAMAMSTVLGISIATTWLLNEQQNIGRRPGVSNVGASPPLPSPDAADATAGPATRSAGSTPTVTASAEARALGTPKAAPRTTLAPSAGAPVSGTPSASPSAPAGGRTSAAAPSPGASRPAGGTASTGSPSGTASGGPAPRFSPQPDSGLSGSGSSDAVGTTGVRHALTLTVGENVTALQVELRLARPEALPGTTPWSSLPGAVVTVAQERGALVYRFTAPVGLDLAPGRYAFGVRGARPADPSERPPQETWAASAFALDAPRALAIRGTFG